MDGIRNHPFDDSMPATGLTMFVPQENLSELIIATLPNVQPPLYLSCDWLHNPLELGMTVDMTRCKCERRN